MGKLNLLDLDSNDAVLGSAIEQLDGRTVGSGFDVALGSTGLGEEVNHGLDALLGEGLVVLGGTRLLVSVTVDGELGVTLHDIVGEELEVSLFTGGELGGAQVEVNGHRGTFLDINSSESAVLVEVGLAVDELAQRSNFLLQKSDLVLQGGVLLLEGGHLVLQGVVLLGGERNRDHDRSDGAVTVEVGLTKIELQTGGSGREDNETTGAIGVGSSLSDEGHEVDGEVHTVAQTQNVEETGTGSILIVVGSALGEGVDTLANIENTHGSIRNEIPETGLFVTADGVGDVPE